MAKLKLYAKNLGLGSIFMFGLIICGFWYPFSTSLNMGYIIPEAIVNLEYFYAILAFYYWASIPCFIIVGMLMRSVNRYHKHNDADAMRSTLNKSAIILGADLIVFLVGNIVLSLFDVNTFGFVYYILIAIGVGVCCMFRYASDRIK